MLNVVQMQNQTILLNHQSENQWTTVVVCHETHWYISEFWHHPAQSSRNTRVQKLRSPSTDPTTPWKTALFASYPLTMLRPAGLLCEPNPLASDPSSWEAHWVPLSWLRESEPELSSAQREGRLLNTSPPALWAVFSDVYLQPPRLPSFAAKVAKRLRGFEDLEQWWKNDLDHRQRAIRLCEDMTWTGLAAAAHPLSVRLQLRSSRAWSPFTD